MSGEMEQTSHLLQQQSQKKQNHLISPNQHQLIDPIQQLIKNNNALPILAVLDHFDINQDIEPDTPLFNLLVNKFLPLDIILQGKKVQFRADKKGKTPLHLAVEADDVKAVYWCLQQGHPSIKDLEGYTPIMRAIRLGYQRCFLLCLQFKHFDNQIAHVAAAFNRVWQLQIMQSLNVNFKDNLDSHSHTPLEVAILYYSYEAAEQLIKLYPQINMDKLSQLTDSSAIIRRLKNIKCNQNPYIKKVFPFMKLMMCFIINLIIVSKNSLFNFTYYYKIYLLVIASLYVMMVICNYSSNIKKKQNKSILMLVQAPDFPTLKQICPKCLHFKIPDYDHCDQWKCCVRKFHFCDFICINYSNQNLWGLAELCWLSLCYSISYQLIYNSIALSGDQPSIVPIILQPLRTIQYYYLVSDYQNLFSTIWIILFTVNQLFICLEVLGIAFMGRTYQQVNNTQKYRHLYRIVKLKDGSYRNKEIRIFEKGVCIGLGIGLKNIAQFFFA